MPSSALVTQLFSWLMRVYRSFPPVAPCRELGRVQFDVTDTERQTNGERQFSW
jgi:hypothetical protein